MPEHLNRNDLWQVSDVLSSFFLDIRELIALFIANEILKLVPSSSDDSNSFCSISTVKAVWTSRYLLSNVKFKTREIYWQACKALKELALFISYVLLVFMYVCEPLPA